MNAIIKQCTGEAHRNPYIDHCYECMPYWEQVPYCPQCGSRVRETAIKNPAKRFYCPKCRIHLGEQK